MKEQRKKSKLSKGIVLLVVIDLVTKLLARRFLNIEENVGISWGMLTGLSGVASIFILLGVVILVISIKGLSVLERTLFISGALGNLIDRIANRGAVTDWLLLPYIKLWFNIADIYLVIGVLLAILSELRKKDELSHSKL